jgi:hypothetical protein
MREMTRNQDVPRLMFGSPGFGPQLLSNPLGWIVWLQIPGGRELGERVARAPERLCGLLCPQLATVPDDVRPDASTGGHRSQLLDLGTPDCRQRAARIDVGADCVTVMNEREMHVESRAARRPLARMARQEGPLSE